MSNVGDFILVFKSKGGRAEQGAGGERNGNSAGKRREAKVGTRVLISLGDTQVHCSLDY